MTLPDPECAGILIARRQLSAGGTHIGILLLERGEAVLCVANSRWPDRWKEITHKHHLTMPDVRQSTMQLFVLHPALFVQFDPLEVADAAEAAWSEFCEGRGL